MTDLERMPKPPVPGLVTSVGAQARIVFCAGLVLGAVGGALLWISQSVARSKPWEIAGGVLLALSATPLLTGALMGLWATVQGGKRRELSRGMYYVHWRYDAAQWEEHCQRTHAMTKRFVPLLAACGAGAAVVFAAMVHFDDDRLFFGTVLAHYGVCTAIGATAGVAIGWFCQRLANITHRLQQTLPAQAVIGPAGVYVTGQFAPLSTFGHRLKSVSMVSEPPACIRFLFEVKTKHGWNESAMLIPIPPGKQQEAETLVELLSNSANEP